MDFGTKFLPANKIEFNFWAPDSKTVGLCVKNPNIHLNFEIPMKMNTWEFNFLLSVSHEQSWRIDVVNWHCLKGTNIL